MAEDLHTKGKFNVLQVSQAGSHMGDYESSKICNDETKGKNLTSFTFAHVTACQIFSHPTCSILWLNIRRLEYSAENLHLI